MINLLEYFSITLNDYSKYRFFDTNAYYSRKTELSRMVYDNIVKKGDSENIWKIFGKNSKKIEISLVDMIRRYISDSLASVTISAEYYSKDYEKVYIWTRKNFTVPYIVESSPFIIRNLNTSFFVFLEYFFVFSVKLIKKFNFNKKNISTSKNTFERIRNNPEVLYFPHKGISYGNLFKKDYYYIDNEYSPLNQKKVFHLEYNISENSELFYNIKKEYEARECLYEFIPKIGKKQMLNGLTIFFKKLGLKSFILFLTTRVDALILYLSLFIYFNHYKKELYTFKNAKIAIIGYDFLFPKELSLVLDFYDIKTIAIQERFMSPYIDDCNVIVDNYLVWGDAIKTRLESTNLSYCKNIYCIKPPRLKYINSHKNKIYSKYKNIKSNYSKFVLAFDFHSSLNKIDNMMLPIINWDNNKIFYKDIIKLAIELHDVCFIIRGKDDLWSKLDYFTDIIEIIDSMDNVIIDRSYNVEDNSSYQLLSLADLVIARHTSIADEALAINIPVIFHDYGQNFNKLVSSIYDYEQYTGFIFSYEQLNKATKAMLFNKKTYYLNHKENIFTSDDNSKIENYLTKILDEQNLKL